MQGYELRFKVYADNQAEADDAAKEIKDFIAGMASNGRAVTARKIAEAVRRYRHNIFVTNYFK